MTKRAGRSEQRRDSSGAGGAGDEQDAGRILTQNSVQQPLENVWMSRILLRARDPGNPGPRNGAIDRPGSHNRDTIDIFRIRS
ncbi:MULTISPECIES: hypothetical protein [Burkholderia]|uniref:Uncharacterized protein n=3 Tax=Burkholderia cepacia complex TaxID=87882 RepID=A0ABT8NPW8_9BURK|nr:MULTISPECIES: hypothetical protein [Burkholderia]MBJ9669726.1 hypothetical protein [Burkholderia cenocepacia]MBJ9879397.1 hypothetical protein [Burkholderia cenocepacia]MBK1822452.1 hypothetical protein [Burkholderia orbicola]MDN7483901.1 hypothetical protein [Burkholderia orbicola]MDN7523618.1 hypothetical protein [Burkholderia orbicola]